MTTDKPIKCASNEFTSSPFYLIQSNGSDQRFVASFKDTQHIKQLLNLFIENSDSALQVKIRDFENYENPRDFDGEVEKPMLCNALEKHEEIVFHDGYHDLMIRIPKTEDYIVFDEHGLIFIYTQLNYSEILENLGLEHKPNEKLIYHFGHWHYSPPNGREGLRKLINELGLN